MVPNQFSSTNNLIHGVEEFIKTCHQTPVQNPVQNPCRTLTSDGQILHVIHRLDDSNNGSSAEVQRLQREVIEKDNRIKELEAMHEHFIKESDRLQCNIDALKEQFEAYERNHPAGSGNQSKAFGDSSSQPKSFSGNSQTSGCSSEVGTESQSSGGLVMTQKVIQHFNTLGIDLRTFYNQMTKGDSILPPFKELPVEFQRHKSTKAARSKRAKILEFMNTYPNGPKACITNYSRLTASKLYENEVKRSK
jgi:hypothetical protein